MVTTVGGISCDGTTSARSSSSISSAMPGTLESPMESRSFSSLLRSVSEITICGCADIGFPSARQWVKPGMRLPWRATNQGLSQLRILRSHGAPTGILRPAAPAQWSISELTVRGAPAGCSRGLRVVHSCHHPAAEGPRFPGRECVMAHHCIGRQLPGAQRAQLIPRGSRGAVRYQARVRKKVFTKHLARMRGPALRTCVRNAHLWHLLSGSRRSRRRRHHRPRTESESATDR